MENAYKWSKPFTLFSSIVNSMNGIAFFTASFHRPVRPKRIPNWAKRKLDKAIVGSLTYIARKLAATATMKALISVSLFLICQRTRRFTARRNTLTCKKP